jgi:general secretion pathway protein B
MSFILDALRKSEQERQQGSVPIISSMPLALARPRLPKWALAIMVALSIALAAVAGLWWQTRAPATQEARMSRAPAEAEPAQLERSAVPPTGPGAAERVSAPATALPASDLPPIGTRPAAARVAPAAAPLAAPADGVTIAPLTPATPSIGPAARSGSQPSVASLPPTRAELLARGIEIPPLELQLHVYAPIASQRFVFINGAKLTEGEALANGPAVVEITSDGVVLRQAGTDFFLPRS